MIQCLTFIYLSRSLGLFHIIMLYIDVSVKFVVPCQSMLLSGFNSMICILASYLSFQFWFRLERGYGPQKNSKQFC